VHYSVKFIKLLPIFLGKNPNHPHLEMVAEQEFSKQNTEPKKTTHE